MTIRRDDRDRLPLTPLQGARDLGALGCLASCGCALLAGLALAVALVPRLVETRCGVARSHRLEHEDRATARHAAVERALLDRERGATRAREGGAR